MILSYSIVTLVVFLVLTVMVNSGNTEGKILRFFMFCMSIWSVFILIEVLKVQS